MGEILSKQMSLDVSYHTDTISVTIKVVSQAQFWWLLVVLCLPAWASAHFPSAFTPCQEDAPSWRNTACGFLCSQDFIFFHLMKHSACFICRHNYLIVCLSLFCFFLSFFSSRNQNQRTGILLEDLFWDCGHWLSWFSSRHMESNTWSTSSEFEQAGWLHWLPLWIHWCHPSCLYVYYGCSEKQSWHLSSKCCCDVMSSAPYSEV